MRTINYILFVLLVGLFSCNGAKNYNESHTIKITGKPVRLSYVYHLSEGYVQFRYSGKIDGKVGVCETLIPCSKTSLYDNDNNRCPWIDTLQGTFKNQLTRLGADNYLEGGKNHKCFTFIPESPNVTGEITVEFREGTGSDYWNPSNPSSKVEWNVK